MPLASPAYLYFGAAPVAQLMRLVPGDCRASQDTELKGYL